MAAKEARLKNVGGLAEKVIPLGKVTLIHGGNGVGKTSAVSGLSAIITGGASPELVKIGTEGGRAILVMDDNTVFDKALGGRGKLTVKDANGATVPSPQTVANQTFGPNLVANPVDLLNASTAAERKAWVSRAMPLRVTKEQIEKATGFAYDGPTEGHALDVLRKFETELREDRRKVNVEAESKRKAVDQWTATLGPEPDASETAAALQGELDRLSAEYVKARETKATELEIGTRSARDKYYKDASTAVDGKRAKIRELEQQIRALEAEVAEIQGAYTEQVGNLDRQLAQAKEFEIGEIDKVYQPKLQDIRARKAAAEEREKNAAARRRQQELIDQTRRDAEKLEQESGDYSAAIAGIETLRNELMKQMPVKNVEIREDDVYINGVPWTVVNDGERTRKAIALTVRAVDGADSPLILVDKIEALDTPNFQRLVEGAKAVPNIQWVFAKRSDGPLQIEQLA